MPVVAGGDDDHVDLRPGQQFEEVDVGGAFLVAAPISYVVMNRWLSDFEFRTELGADLLILAGAMSLVIAWMTVAYQSIKVATANPVVALRSE